MMYSNIIKQTKGKGKPSPIAKIDADKRALVHCILAFLLADRDAKTATL